MANNTCYCDCHNGLIVNARCYCSCRYQPPLSERIDLSNQDIPNLCKVIHDLENRIYALEQDLGCVKAREIQFFQTLNTFIKINYNYGQDV